MLGLFLIAISMGFSNFAAAIGIGLSGVDAKKRIQMGIIFGIFEGGMPIVGLLLGQSFSQTLGRDGRIFGAGLLILIGIYLFWSARKEKEVEKFTIDILKPLGDKMETKGTIYNLLLTGFALSLDNLVIGFALSFYLYSLWLLACVIALVSVGMSLVGLEFGKRLGEKFEKWSQKLGAIILILVGIALGFNII